MNQNRVNQILQLPDGRDLGFAEYGTQDGNPVFYFTGGNSSRLEGRWFEQTALEKNIRLIVPDRPGFGLSPFYPHRTLLNWADDVLALADHLEISSFSIFGLSGGGPHVLSLAYSIPERLNKIAVVSGTAPPEMPHQRNGMWLPVRLIFISAKRWPALNRFLLKQMANFYSDTETMKSRMKQALPKPDVELLEKSPEIFDIFAKSATEAHASGIDGDVLEWQLYVNDWGVPLEAIKAEVLLYYGLYDQQVPIYMGRYLHQVLPNSKLIEVENGGHFSTINNYCSDLFDYFNE